MQFEDHQDFVLRRSSVLKLPECSEFDSTRVHVKFPSSDTLNPYFSVLEQTVYRMERAEAEESVGV